MRIVPRLALTTILIAITAFCGFMFLASFEQPGLLMVRWLCGAVAIACVIVIMAVWLGETTRS